MMKVEETIFEEEIEEGLKKKIMFELLELLAILIVRSFGCFWLLETVETVR